jgi:plasmid stability protein
MRNEAPAMLQSMADNPKRPRMVFDFPERLRRAIRIRAARLGLGPSDTVSRILEAALMKELQEADESLATGEEPPPSKRGRPKRK